jgi:hypothetical protein
VARRPETERILSREELLDFIIVWWAVLTVVAFIVWFVATMLSAPNERFQTPPNKSSEAPAK